MKSIFRRFVSMLVAISTLLLAGCRGPQTEEIPKTKADFQSHRDLDRLVPSLETETAIYAAWERLFRDTNEAETAVLAAERFLGFLEGRLEVSIPNAWEETIRAIEFYEDGSHGFSPRPRLGGFVTTGYEVDVFDGQWRLRGDAIDIGLNGNERSFWIADRNSSNYGYPWAVASIDDKGAIVGSSCGFPRSYPLMRIDRDANVVWEATVHCCEFRNLPDHMGFASVCAEIAVGESTVVVFGESFSVLYVEGFDLDTGNNLFRFSSHDWNPQ